MTRSRALVIALLAALAVWVFIYKAGPKMPDFEVYWKAGGRAAQAQALYRTDDGHFQFKYLPAFAILAIPFGLIPLQTAKLLWFAISIALLVQLVRASARLPLERRRPYGWLVGVMIVVFGKFYAHELVLGQVNILFAVVATTALLSIKAGREGEAGALIALAIVIKPYAVLFLPWLVARRQLMSVSAAFIGLAVALALPAIVYGFDGNVHLHREWWRTVTETTAPNLSVYDNVSLAGMYFRWVGPGPLQAQLAYGTAALLLALTAIVFLLRRGVRFPEGLEGGLLLTLMPLLSPQGWDYVFLIATPAIVYLANYADRLPQPLRALTALALLTIGLVVFDLLGRRLYYEFMRLSFISLCFFVVIGALAVLRARKAA
ncbi:MAG TPA: glycosyltransferase family 87 protein [Vicinamibacterales bacterium]|nr:glycosyltransferase family 87 protein [Vicinamibacterales bacterium]